MEMRLPRGFSTGLPRPVRRYSYYCLLSTAGGKWPITHCENASKLIVIQLSLSRLNHRLPRGQTDPEVMQGTAEFHHEIADAVLPQPDPVFDDTAALDAAVDMLDPEPTVVQSLIGQFLLPRQLLATGFLGWHQDLHLGQRKRQALLLDSRVLCDQ